MAVQIQPVQKKADPVKGIIPAAAGAVGQVFGGPIGGMAGQAVGQMAVKDEAGPSPVSSDQLAGLLSRKNAEPQKEVAGGVLTSSMDYNSSSPVSRWQENNMNLTAMQNGMKTLETNPALKQQFGGVFSQALQRAKGGPVA